MRKPILITAAIILILLFSVIGILEYRQYISYKIPVHATAKTILKVNVDGFIRSLLKEYGFSFRKEMNSSKKPDSTITLKTGIYPSANVFIYNLSTRSTATLFCSLQLTNAEEFQNFLLKAWGVTFAGHKGQAIGTALHGEITILCSQKLAAIAWSSQKEEVITILDDLVNKKNLLKPDDALFVKLKQDRSHLVGVSRDGQITGELSGKHFLLRAAFTIPSTITIPDQSVRRITDSSLPGSFYINIKPLGSAPNRKIKIREYSLDTDSLFPYFKGYADLDFSGFHNQQDTVITYDYSENFEKIERKTLANSSVPVLDLTLKAEPMFLSYLLKQDFIRADQHLNPRLFPLYPVFVKQAGSLLLFSRDAGSVPQQQFTNTADFLDLDIHFNKMLPLQDSSWLKKYIAGITRLKITGRKKSNREISMEGSLDFDSSAIRTVVQLLNSR